MIISKDRILTTHVGSLPRSKAVTDCVFAHEKGEPMDAANEIIAKAVKDIVQKQVEARVDIVSDGEMSKISYATYIKDRITGFDGDSPRSAPKDLEDFPEFLKRQSSGGGTPTYRRPCCIGPIKVKSMQPLQHDLDNFAAALEGADVVEGFMNAASPGVIALFQPNHHYKSQEEYLEALAEAMRHEYEAIVDAGYILQLDSPDLGLGKHMMFKNEPENYAKLAGAHVEALNHALRNIDGARVRMHICWGNYEGPHHHDAAMSEVMPVALRAKPQGLLFENSNPRHAHEWAEIAEMDIPEDKILIPGVIDSTTTVSYTHLRAHET